MYVMLGALYVLTCVVWVVAILAVRWLLTGRRPRFMRHATRVGAYVCTVSAVEATVGAIILTRIVLRAGSQVHGRLPAILIGSGPPIVMILTLGVVYLVDRRGRTRRARRSHVGY